MATEQMMELRARQYGPQDIQGRWFIQMAPNDLTLDPQEAAQRLLEAGVPGPKDKLVTTRDGLLARFKSRAEAQGFLVRLNCFLIGHRTGK